MNGRVAIVDFGVGNLFSIDRACVLAGLEPTVTSSASDVARARCLILPGIGAFGDAMAALHRLGLIEPLRRAGSAGVPIVGVCLGMQLLMEQSQEFGTHEGLGLIKGTVEPLAPLVAPAKTPHVGWSRVFQPRRRGDASSDEWADTLLEGTPDGSAMYFVHSYVARPHDPAVTAAVTAYAGLEFCAAVRSGAMIGFQFHPERSGPAGLQVYHRLAQLLSPVRS